MLLGSRAGRRGGITQIEYAPKVASYRTFRLPSEIAGGPAELLLAPSNGASMKPIVFLNFDEALAVHKLNDAFRVLDANALATIDAFPEMWLNVFDATPSRNLHTLHKEFKPRYVITSYWASHLDEEKMRKMLKRSGLKFVALNLCEPWQIPRDVKSGRLAEIEAWLKLHVREEEHDYIVIDANGSADTLPGSWLEEKTVLCDAQVGFTATNLKEAVQILSSMGKRADIEARTGRPRAKPTQLVQEDAMGTKGIDVVRKLLSPPL